MVGEDNGVLVQVPFSEKGTLTSVAEPTAIMCECGGPQIQQLLSTFVTTQMINVY